ncbi:anthranilate synthase component II [candidate division KSB1 bacterium]
MILVIDNYDSFTYNLVQYLEVLGRSVKVFRNDRISLSEIARLAPSRIVISPGPGRPEAAGITVELIRRFADNIPILGVCLGAQAVGVAFGGKVVQAPELMHGKVSDIHHRGHPLFEDVSNPFTATRYHSLMIERGSLPAELDVIAWTADELVMGVTHRNHPSYGVQFHPESIMTEAGMKILENFINLADA